MKICKKMYNNYRKIGLGTKKYLSYLSIKAHMMFRRRLEQGIKQSKSRFKYPFF